MLPCSLWLTGRMQASKFETALQILHSSAFLEPHIHAAGRHRQHVASLFVMWGHGLQIGDVLAATPAADLRQTHAALLPEHCAPSVKASCLRLARVQLQWAGGLPVTMRSSRNVVMGTPAA